MADECEITAADESVNTLFKTPLKRQGDEASSEEPKHQKIIEGDEEYYLQVNRDSSITLTPGTNSLTCLETIGDDDPAAMLVYDDDKCISSIALLNALPPGTFPLWLNSGTSPISLAQFKTSLINRVHQLAAVPALVVGHGLIAPLYHFRACQSLCGNELALSGSYL